MSRIGRSPDVAGRRALLTSNALIRFLASLLSFLVSLPSNSKRRAFSDACSSLIFTSVAPCSSSMSEIFTLIRRISSLMSSIYSDKNERVGVLPWTMLICIFRVLLRWKMLLWIQVLQPNYCVAAFHTALCLMVCCVLGRVTPAVGKSIHHCIAVQQLLDR